jgi:hypothetical protein
VWNEGGKRGEGGWGKGTNELLVLLFFLIRSVVVFRVNLLVGLLILTSGPRGRGELGLAEWVVGRGKFGKRKRRRCDSTTEDEMRDGIQG